MYARLPWGKEDLILPSGPFLKGLNRFKLSYGVGPVGQVYYGTQLGSGQGEGLPSDVHENIRQFYGSSHQKRMGLCGLDGYLREGLYLEQFGRRNGYIILRPGQLQGCDVVSQLLDGRYSRREVPITSGSVGALAVIAELVEVLG